MCSQNLTKEAIKEHRQGVNWKLKCVNQLQNSDYIFCNLNGFKKIDVYVEDGGPEAVWRLCSFNHNPLRH